MLNQAQQLETHCPRVVIHELKRVNHVQSAILRADGDYYIIFLCPAANCLPWRELSCCVCLGEGKRERKRRKRRENVCERKRE